MSSLASAAEDARGKRELRADIDPRQLAFELEGALLSANWYFYLNSDHTYLERARRAVRTQLANAATRTGLRSLSLDPGGI